MSEWLPAWDVLCAYVACGAIGALTMLVCVKSWWIDASRERHRREVADMKREHAAQLAAVAGEQMMLRSWGPLSQRMPTIRG
jgi:hypothetical protein